MYTSTQPFVGAGYDDESFLVFAFEGFGFGFVEDGVGGFTVAARFIHSTLGAGELGGGDNLHCFGDFLDVFDGFQALFDFTEGGIAGGVGSHRPIELKLAITCNTHNHRALSRLGRL